MTEHNLFIEIFEKFEVQKCEIGIAFDMHVISCLKAMSNFAIQKQKV